MAPDQPADGKGQRIDEALALLDNIQIAGINSLVRKARRGQLTTADLRVLAQLREQLREKTGGQEPQTRVARTATQLAKTFSVSRRQVYRWLKAGLPRRADGAFDLGAVQLWLVERERGPAKDERTTRDQLRAIQIEYRQVKTELERMKLARERGELVDASEMEQHRCEQFRAFRTAVLAVPGALAPQLVGLDLLTIKRLLDERLKHTLRIIASQ